MDAVLNYKMMFDEDLDETADYEVATVPAFIQDCND
jgi:hypothetical protein